MKNQELPVVAQETCAILLVIFSKNLYTLSPVQNLIVYFLIKTQLNNFNNSAYFRCKIT